MNPEIIHKAYTEGRLTEEAKQAVRESLKALDEGRVRISEKRPTGWHLNEWLKQAVLLYFKISKLREFSSLGGDFNFFDKIPLKKWTGKEGVRAVPQALVRYGAHIGRGAVLMPSYVNIGAYVDEGTLIDTWATVGSCAQVGKGVHVSGGVGIGGVLEPIQAQPVVIEDHVFIGSRAVIVEGVCVREGAVLGAGLVLTKSIKIIDVTQKPAKEHTGEIPQNAVVIPGSRARAYPAGEYQIPCALIIGRRSKRTDKKISLNQALREFNIPV